MDKKKAAEYWEVTDGYVKKICKHMNIDPSNIPEDTVPVYVPDYRYTKDPHRFYIFVLDVIINSHLELEGFDLDIIKTCVLYLKQADLIVLKHGRNPDSVDYHDYMVSPNRELFYNWKNAKMRKKIDMITPVISAIAEGVTASATVRSAL